jgi:hypothetical protein
LELRRAEGAHRIGRQARREGQEGPSFPRLVSWVNPSEEVVITPSFPG